MLQRKYEPLTKEIQKLDEMLECLDLSCAPKLPSAQEQIVYWLAAKQNNDMKRSVKK